MANLTLIASCYVSRHFSRGKCLPSRPPWTAHSLFPSNTKFTRVRYRGPFSPRPSPYLSDVTLPVTACREGRKKGGRIR